MGSRIEFGQSPENGSYKTLSAPVTIQWELTSLCNEKCIHCYNFWRTDQFPQKSIAISEIRKLYNKASLEIIKNKIFQVTITGGEPLIMLDIAYPYLQRLADNGIDLSMNTNLTLFTKEQSIKLKKNRN